jgi:hypothetical protein
MQEQHSCALLAHIINSGGFSVFAPSSSSAFLAVSFHLVQQFGSFFRPAP